MIYKCIALFNLIPTSQPHYWLIAADWLEEEGLDVAAAAFREGIWEIIDKKYFYKNDNGIFVRFFDMGDGYGNGIGYGSGRGVSDGEGNGIISGVSGSGWGNDCWGNYRFYGYGFGYGFGSGNKGDGKGVSYNPF